MEEQGQSRKVKYFAIGTLYTVQLNFMRIRYKYELLTCLNEKSDEEMFYNASVNETEEVVKERLR